jgi:hypothetical protein
MSAKAVRRTLVKLTPDPKIVKRYLTVLFTLSGSTSLKALSKTLMKLTVVVNITNFCFPQMANF